MTVHADDVQQAGPIPPEPRRGMLGRRLAFREPSPEELDQLLSPESLTEGPGEESPEAGAGFDSADRPSDASDPSGSAETGSPGSDTRAGKRRTIFASEEAKRTARNGVFLASVQAHRLLVRTQEQAALNLYVADEEDQANIGDPLANIAARRTGAVSDNPDVNDAIQGLLGFGNYLVKQFQLSMIAKRQHMEAGAPETIPGEVA